MSQVTKVKEHTATLDVPTPEASATFTVRIAQLGRKMKDLQVSPGTRLKDVIQSLGLTGTEIRLRGAQMPTDTILQEDDLILSIPDAIVGGQEVTSLTAQ